jgi:short-subunit dehydrogenase
MKNPRYIIITGASSGIGASLALAYAAPDVTLGLLGRSAERLQEIARQCAEKGAIVETATIDVNDTNSMEHWIASFQRIDLVIVNAGISGGTAEGVNDEQVREIFSTNIGGSLNTILPAINKMKAQPAIQGKKGQIAIMSSVAGLRGLPSSPAYSASKAAMAAYGDALRGSLRREQIDVSVIMPGYVRTPLTDTNNFFMPFIIRAEKAAEKIKNGLSKNKKRIFFPFIMYGLVRTLAAMPYKVTDPLFRILPRKD